IWCAGWKVGNEILTSARWHVGTNAWSIWPACSRADVQTCRPGFKPYLGGSERPQPAHRILRRLRIRSTRAGSGQTALARLGQNRDRHRRQSLGACRSGRRTRGHRRAHGRDRLPRGHDQRRRHARPADPRRLHSLAVRSEPRADSYDRADIPGIFLPRDSGLTRRTPPPLRVSVGASSRAGAESLGVKLGQTITMPKQYVRLAGTRATGRSFDDRMGCASLILALRTLNLSKLRHPVVFIFSTREEIGLEGAGVVARQLGTSTRRVHAIDTFVSADSPLELPNFAVARLGAGAVARALDNSSITPPADVDTLAQLARARGVALQIGTTNGGNDGSTFVPYGVVDVPMGWPLRYSHSPVEIVDLRDLVSLADMVRVVAEDW